MVGKTRTSVDSKKATAGYYIEQLNKLFNSMSEASNKNSNMDDLIEQFENLQAPALSFTTKQDEIKSKLLNNIQKLIDQSQVKSSDNQNSQKEEAEPIMPSVTSNEAQSNETDIGPEKTTTITEEAEPIIPSVTSNEAQSNETDIGPEKTTTITEEAEPIIPSVTSNEAQSNETDIGPEKTTTITEEVTSFEKRPIINFNDNETIENLNLDDSGSEDNEEVTILLNQNKIQPTQEIFSGYTNWYEKYGKTHPVLNKNLKSSIDKSEQILKHIPEDFETHKNQILKCMDKAINGRSKWLYFTQDGKKELLEDAKKRFDDDPCPRNLQIFLAICQAHRTSRENSLFPHAETSSFSAFKKALPEELKKQMFNEEPKQNFFNIWGKK